MIGPAREHLAKFGLSPEQGDRRGPAGEFGAEAGMLGAAAMAFVECLDEPLEDV